MSGSGGDMIVLVERAIKLEYTENTYKHDVYFYSMHATTKQLWSYRQNTHRHTCRRENSKPACGQTRLSMRAAVACGSYCV